MSIGSMFAAITGLRAHSSWMTTIGNNIANTNTTGYKASRVTFGDLFSQTVSAPMSGSSTLGGINAMQTGLGSKIAAVDILMTQGAMTATTKATDLAIDGNGFFILKTGTSYSYTRAGDFSFDNTGNLVSPDGQIVQGWMSEELILPFEQFAAPGVASNTVLQSAMLTIDTSNPSAITNITIPPKDLTLAQKTSLVTVGGNLDNIKTLSTFSGSVIFAANPTVSNVQDPTNAFGYLNVFDNLTPDGATSRTVYDSLGQQRELTMWFFRDTNLAAPANAPRWDWYAFDTTGGNAPTATNCIGGSFITADIPVPNDLNPPLLAASVYQAIQFNGDGSLANNGGFVTTVADTRQDNPIVVMQPIVATALGYVQNNGAIKSFNIEIDFGTGNMWRDAGLNDISNVVTSLNGEYQWGQRDGLTGDVVSTDPTAPQCTPYVKEQNGYPDGTLLGVNVDSQGYVIGSFTNGMNVKLARVAMASFANPQGLLKVGNSRYVPSNNSGTPIIGTSGTYDLGSIQSFTLESSNVDLATELTNMIIAQRGFEVNARVITTSDGLLNTLINLGR